MRVSLTCALLLAAGCAGAPAERPVSAPTRVVTMSGGEAEIRLQPEARSEQAVLPVSASTAWQALGSAYRELGLPVTASDSVARVLETRGFETRRQIGGRRLSAFFSCGTNLTGEIADQRRIRIDLVSRITGTAEESVIHTLLSASARSDQGASADPVACSSRGALEQLIATRVRLAVARGLTPAP